MPLPAKINPIDLMRQRAKERLEGKGGGTGSNHIRLPDGCKFIKVETETEYGFNFVGYVVKMRNHPDGVAPGTVWPRMPFWMHRNMGPEKARAICRKTIGRACPACEEKQLLFAQKAAKADIERLYNSYRELYIMPAETEGEWEVLEMPYASFGKILDKRMNRRNDETYGYYLDEGGFTVVVTFSEETTGTHSYPKVDEVSFEKRDVMGIDPASVPCLEEMLNIMSYTQFKAMLLEVSEEEVCQLDNLNPGDEPGTARKVVVQGASRPAAPPPPAEEPAASPPSTARRQPVRRAAAPPPVPEPAPQGEELGPECPSGHEFGTAGDHTECEKCDQWDACAEVAQQTAEAEEPAPPPPPPPPAPAERRFAGRRGAVAPAPATTPPPPATEAPAPSRRFVGRRGAAAQR